MPDALRAGPANERAAVARRWRAAPRQWSARAYGLLALLTACLAATAIAALVVQLDVGERSGAATPPPPATNRPSPVTASAHVLARWLRANLPPATPVIADRATARLLRGGGQTKATSDVRRCRAGAVVVLTEAIRQRAHHDAALRGCLASSVAIAAQGTEQVRDVASDRSDILRERSAALALQRRGGAALARNPSITMPSTVRTALLDGRLDLRADAVLTDLAARTPLHLTAIDDVAAEARAHMPARTVEIAVGDPTDVEPRLQDVAVGYRPLQVVRSGSTHLRLTWPFRIDPPPVLH